ncbi:MAG: molybdate ABC transporter substrate-binding protein [Desulfovibrio sp.]|nr:molybdate ABC transporter substrate-binding protein [Desulfovibrio sp.]
MSRRKHIAALNGAGIRFRLLILSLLLASFFLAPGRTEASELTVSAAASLTNAFTELKGLYEAQHKGLTVFTNFAASTPLLKQIEAGAPVDVFASADQETMDKAEKAGLVASGTRENFVRNTLVLIVPKGKSKPESLSALKGFARIAIGNPDSVPAGRYAREALKSAGLYDTLTPSFILGTNVRQVLDYVARGEVDCGIVYGTDAKKQENKVDVAMVLQGHKEILYPIALIKTGKNAKDAQDFITFVRSEKGMSVLEHYGFARP